MSAPPTPPVNANRAMISSAERLAPVSSESMMKRRTETTAAAMRAAADPCSIGVGGRCQPATNPAMMNDTMAMARKTRAQLAELVVSVAIRAIKTDGSSRPRQAEVAASTTRHSSEVMDATVASMASLKGTKTEENLKAAFARESQASRRYLYFAQMAEVEGFPVVAELFRSVAESETGHAFGHLDFLIEVGDPATGEPAGSTDENLRAAIAGETYDYTEMYPNFAEVARAEGFDEIGEWMESLARAEESQAARFAEGLKSVS